MKLLRNQKGGAAIAFILFASVAAAFLASNLNTVLDIVSKKKKENRVTAEMDTFTRGVIAYTTYALKERWCLDDSWGKSEECQGDMHNVISYKYNLERLLWSSAAVSAIKNAYKSNYNKEIGFEPGLESIKAKIQTSSLNGLGKSHPLNLSLTDSLRYCIDHINIELKRAENSSLFSSGDERYIEIFVEGVMKNEPRCESYETRPYGKSLVGFFPRTLNQFAIIKGGDLDLTKYSGTQSTYGLNIHAPVYVDNDLILPTSGYSPVGIYSNIYLGRGEIKTSSGRFIPKSFGGFDDQLYSTYKHLKTLKRGVVFEAKVDEGIGVLFGNEYYVDTALADKCKIWTKLENNPMETKDSRLFGRETTGGFSIGLSQTELPISNEFKDYSYPSEKVSSQLGYINILEDNKGFISYIKKGTKVDEKPVMRLDIEVDENSSMAQVLLGRDSSIKIELQPITTNVEQILNTELANVELACKSLDLNFKEIQHSGCEIIDKNFNDGKTQTICSQAYDGKPNRISSCEDNVKYVDTSLANYEAKQNEINAQEEAKASTPRPYLEISLSSVTSNIVNFDVDLKNASSLNKDGFQSFKEIKLNIIAFDFIVQTSANPITGGRKSFEMPGPNDESNPNIIVIDIQKNKDGEFTKLEYVNADSKKLDGWKLLKKDAGANEPPRIPLGGEDGKLSNDIYLPATGLSLAESEELDDKCSEIPDSDSFQWDISFTKNTLHSWMYDVGGVGVSLTGTMVMQDLYRFDETNMYPGDAGGIPNQSVTEKCIIPSEVNFIFGFYACKELIIEPRARRLTFIGTLLTNKLNISNDALTAGIDFYNIWHPTAVEKLRETRWLAQRGPDGELNDCKKNVTVWDKNLSRQELFDLRTCSPIHFVLEGPNNYNWTTVDPEIGLPESGGLVTKSKIPNRYRRFNIQTFWVETGEL